MEKTYFDHALEIVKTKAAGMTADEIVAETKALATKLEAAANGETVPVEGAVKLVPNFNAGTAIGVKSVISGLDGKPYKIIGEAHCKKFGTTLDAYLAACGYPKGTKLVCKELQKFRREKMAGMELWKRRKSAQAPAEAY